MNVLPILPAALIIALSQVATPTKPPTAEPQYFFRGTGIHLTQRFQCGGIQPAGIYGLEARRTTGELTALRVIKEGTKLCEVPGSPTPDYDTMVVSKVRIFNRINKKAKAIEIDVIVPTASRKRTPNQAFYLPLASEY